MKDEKTLISIVDDDEIIRKLLTVFLLRSAYEIAFEAVNGADCIKKLQAAEVCPDVIIMDIEMPVMDGFETVIKIKSLWPSIKIIVHSGLRDLKAQNRMLALGADKYLFKGKESSGICEVVEELLTR